MKKQITHIEQLEQFDEQQFAAWFRRGFEDLFHEDREVMAFDPLHYYIGRQNDIIDDLKIIYDALSGTAKENFRLGIKLSFSSLPPENRYVPLIRSYLHLAGKVHAIEILPEIVKQIGNGYFGIVDNNEGNELFALSLDTLAGMASYPGIGNIVRQLVGSSFFKSDYAPLAFFALFRAEPDRFPDHLKLLRQDFATLHKEKGTRTSFITALRFVQYVDLETISRKLWRLFLTRNPEVIKALPNDNWFGEALFVGKKAPLIISKDNHFYLCRRIGQRKPYRIITSKRNANVKLSDDNDVHRFLNYLVEITQQDRFSQSGAFDRLPRISQEICKLSLGIISNPHYFPYRSNGMESQI